MGGGNSIIHDKTQCWFLRSASCFYFYAPLKKGTYCFATVGRSVGLSVGRSVCRSVDQVLSAQYLLTPSLDQYQTRCRDCVNVNVNSSSLLYVRAEIKIIRKDFNIYPTYTSITWIGTVYAFSLFIKHKLPQTRLYSYNLGSWVAIK